MHEICDCVGRREFYRTDRQTRSIVELCPPTKNWRSGRVNTGMNEKFEENFWGEQKKFDGHFVVCIYIRNKAIVHSPVVY